MHSHRAVFQKVIEIADNNEQLPESLFWGYFQDTYAVTQGAAVRRQAEVSDRVVSLGLLIAEIGKDPERLSRKVWTGMWERDPRPEIEQLREREADRAFTDQFAPGGGNYLDPAIPKADLATLKKTAKSVTGYVNRHIAHSDRNPAPIVPKFSDLNAAIDVVGDLFTRYGNLLTASTFVTLVPEPQHDWLAIFRVPWLRD